MLSLTGASIKVESAHKTCIVIQTQTVNNKLKKQKFFKKCIQVLFVYSNFVLPVNVHQILVAPHVTHTNQVVSIGAAG